MLAHPGFVETQFVTEFEMLQVPLMTHIEIPLGWMRGHHEYASFHKISLSTPLVIYIAYQYKAYQTLIAARLRAEESFMDIGILVAATARTGAIDAIAQAVEKGGYESLWIPEHPVIPVGFKTQVPGGFKLPEHYGRWVDPFVALSIAAAVTKRIKLATGICLLPEREPLITAKAVASLDLYSGGRVVLGVGAGWLREETEAMGAHFGSRWKRLRETVEAMRVAWTEAEPAYQGEIVHFPALRCEPKLMQKPYPPILL